jgi:hypothetical protein
LALENQGKLCKTEASGDGDADENGAVGGDVRPPGKALATASIHEAEFGCIPSGGYEALMDLVSGNGGGRELYSLTAMRVGTRSSEL